MSDDSKVERIPKSAYEIPRVGMLPGRSVSKFISRTTYDSPEHLYADSMTYFQWNDANPLSIHKVMNSRDGPVDVWEEKPRPLSLSGLCMFLRMSPLTWNAWKDPYSPQYWPDAVPVMEWAEMVIYEQKLSQATIGQFNANIVSRELGLAEKQEVATTDNTPKVPKQINLEKLSAQERRILLEALERDDVDLDDDVLE